MERGKDDISPGRAHTDESLGAERATSDSDSLALEANSRRELDDLIEIDRILADSRLLKFRTHADSALARERSESPAPSNAVAIERLLADQEKKTERASSDARMKRERLRSDNAVESERLKQKSLRIEQETRRQATDEQLSTERHGADVTAIALEKALDALAQLQVEQVRRDDVLGIVMHDLRSPLSIISMNASMIVAATQEPATRKGILAVTRGAARMERLLMDLLDVARIQSGTLRLSSSPYDLCALLREVRGSYGILFAERDIEFNVDIPSEEIVVSFDHDRIVQVLSNLLGNAMKFTPAGGSVRLSVERNPGHVEVTLRDNGPGIPAEALPCVFQRFWQVEGGSRRGLGLGLHICEQIIQAHGGRIWVESEPGKGATFHFTLPA